MAPENTNSAEYDLTDEVLRLTAENEILREIAEASHAAWNGGFAFGALPTEPTIDRLATALNSYVRNGMAQRIQPNG